MASPKTMWSGSIAVGPLINIPVTIGKASSEERESSLMLVCVGHDAGVPPQPIDRSERCATCNGPPSNKQKAIKISEDEYRIISENEMADIEGSTKSPILKVLDVQPVKTLPLMYSTQTYYVRHDAKAKISPKAFAALVAAMSKNRNGLIVKWGNSSREKLCVISAESGVLVMRVIPFLTDIRVASKVEREHFRVKVTNAEAAKMSELLHEIGNEDGFQYGNYEDEGLKLRHEAVDRILKGEKPKQRKAKQVEAQTDVFEQIEMSMNALQKEKKTNA